MPQGDVATVHRDGMWGNRIEGEAPPSGAATATARATSPAEPASRGT
jgi:hypothetical protein